MEEKKGRKEYIENEITKEIDRWTKRSNLEIELELEASFHSLSRKYFHLNSVTQINRKPSKARTWCFPKL